MKKVFRTVLILFFTLLAAALAWLAYARFVEPDMLRITPLRLESTGKSLRIALFSDTHFGRGYSDDKIERLVERINGQSPDLVVFAGDFFDNYQRDFEQLDTEYLGAQLARIQGEKVAVYGNHDYGGGAEFVYPKVMEAGGFALLRDQSLYLESLDITVTGYDDLFFRGAATEPGTEAFVPQTSDYNVFICHEPDQAEDISVQAKGIALSGHSHGGQIRLPFVTERILPGGARKFWDAFYTAEQVGGSIPLYVTSGIGTTIMPLRFGNVPEVVLITCTE